MTSEKAFYKEPYTEKAAVEFISMAMSKCDKLKDLSDINGLHAILKSLSGSYFDFRDHRLKMSEILLRRNYLQITNTILENLFKEGYFSDDSVWFPTYFAYNALWNFCDSSQSIATGILNTGIPKMIVDNILCKSYQDSLDDKNTYYLMKASISIIHNIARYPGNQSAFNSKDVKETLVGFIKRNSSDFLGLISMMTLSVLVDETELHLLEEGSNTINCLIAHVVAAHNSSEKRVDGFLVWELVNSLRCVSANDNMKKTILRQGGLNILLTILKDPSNDDDVEKSLGTVWNLCFDNEVTDDSKTVEDIKVTIKPYENSQSPDIKRNYDGIMWLLANKSQFIHKTSEIMVFHEPIEETKTHSKYDIFVSYVVADKSIVSSIKEELMKSNVTIWINSDQDQASSIDITAEGIENSRVFVMALSNEYRASPHCRSEAEYALSLNRPIITLILESHYKPSSWLGLIVGNRSCHVFSEQRFFYDTVRELFNEIISVLNGGSSCEQARTTRQQQQSDKGKSVVESWSVSDVEKWTQNCGLRKLKDMDGPLLQSLMDLRSEAPEFMYRTVQADLGMTLMDILKMRIAFKKLCSF